MKHLAVPDLVAPPVAAEALVVRRPVPFKRGDNACHTLPLFILDQIRTYSCYLYI